MAENWWKDATVRARKVEGGYESLFNLDGEELVVNYFSFAETATILEEELGRKPTPEEVEEDARKTAGDPRGALKGLPPAPPPEPVNDNGTLYGLIREQCPVW